MMEDAAASLFGSGWVWLAQEPSGRLVVLSCKNGDNPVRHNMVPLLGIDVWEHAYYLDYQNRRAEHLHRLWVIVDWSIISERYEG
jgi:Fe-Mn family superoxide dismutase